MTVSVSTGKSLDQHDNWSPRSRSLSLNQLPLEQWSKKREHRSQDD